MKNKKPNKRRNMEAMNMILHCKGGFMKDRRLSRDLEEEDVFEGWEYEEHYDDFEE